MQLKALKTCYDRDVTLVVPKCTVAFKNLAVQDYQSVSKMSFPSFYSLEMNYTNKLNLNIYSGRYDLMDLTAFESQKVFCTTKEILQIFQIF
jgi:hypothetical protein